MKYRCPHSETEFTFTAQKPIIYCPNCGLNWIKKDRCKKCKLKDTGYCMSYCTVDK
jgi:predicted RNA-binding Zn-ribbon protein involved in translation (DUF1610 family)